MKNKWKLLLSLVMLVCLFGICKQNVKAVGQYEVVVGDTSSVSFMNTSGWVVYDYSWQNSNSSVIKLLDATGQICRFKALKPGKATINFSGKYYVKQWNPITGNLDYTYDYCTCSWEINVVKKTKSIKFLRNNIELEKNYIQTLDYIVSPSGASKKLTWTSSNKNVATVKDGKVTALRPGKTTITAKAASGVSASCTVTVVSSCKKIVLNYTQLSLGKGDTFTLGKTLTPSDCTDKVKWSSSNNKIITINSSGKITAKKAGTATITAKCGNKTAKCKVIVKAKAIKKLTPKKKTVSIVRGKTYTLGYTKSPSSAGGTVKWSSSKSSVASVNKNGKVTAKKIGTATITAKASSGVKTTYTIHVIVPAKGIKLNYSELPLGIGKSYTLKATVNPTDSTDKVKWTSGNSSIVKVDSNGKITGVKEGTTWIKATAGNYSSECTVTVSKEVPCSSIEIKKNDPALICETTLELKAKLGGPPTKTDTLSDIQWTSSNPEIASVNSKGVVCGNKEGTVVITACIRGLSVDYPLVITKGEWADISIGEVCVDSKFFYYSGVEYKEIPFDNDIGLTLVQSDSDVGNRVKFKNIKKPHLIFANITTESVKGQELTIELMGGTENTINGMVYPKSVKFTGKGNLHINNDNDCCIETKEGPLYFESGNIYLHRDNLNYYAMRSAEVIMSTVNAKIYIRGSSKQYYCADYNNYLEPGTVITTTYSGRTSLSEIKIKGADSRISVGKWRLLDCYGKYGNEEKYVNRKYVSWTSSNPEIATMDKDGYLDAIAPGVVTISAYYGGKKTAIKVEVIEDTTVDLSDGDLYIWDGYYTRELGGREIPFDGDAGIEIKQSGSDIGKIIVIESLKDVRLILNGVNAEFSGYWDANLILQLKDGTENYGTGMIYGAGDLMIEGAGKLDMKCDGVSVDVRGSISIEDADVTFENVANGYRTAMSYREDLLINGDGHLTMIVKSSDGVKIEADMEAYIEEGKLEVIVK